MAGIYSKSALLECAKYINLKLRTTSSMTWILIDFAERNNIAQSGSVIAFDIEDLPDKAVNELMQIMTSHRLNSEETRIKPHSASKQAPIITPFTMAFSVAKLEKYPVGDIASHLDIASPIVFDTSTSHGKHAPYLALTSSFVHKTSYVPLTVE